MRALLVALLLAILVSCASGVELSRRYKTPAPPDMATPPPPPPVKKPRIRPGDAQVEASTRTSS